MVEKLSGKPRVAPEIQIREQAPELYDGSISISTISPRVVVERQTEVAWRQIEEPTFVPDSAWSTFGVDEAISRPDTDPFIRFAPPAEEHHVQEDLEIPVFKASAVSRRDGKTHRFVRVVKEDARALAQRIEGIGLEVRTRMPKRYDRLVGRKISLEKNQHRAPRRYPSGVQA